MAKRKTPEENPELKPSEEPTNPEVEWVLEELLNNPDPRSLKHSGITITSHLKPRTEKVPAPLPPAIGESPKTAESIFEVLKKDIERHEYEVTILLTQLKVLEREIQQSIRPDDPIEVTKNLEKIVKLRDIGKRVEEAEDAVEQIENIKEYLLAVETDSPEGQEIYKFGEWAIKKIGEITKNRMHGRGPDSEASIAETIHRLTAHFETKYSQYKNKGDT